MRSPGPTHLVVGFESRAEAERFLEEFRERLAALVQTQADGEIG